MYQPLELRSRPSDGENLDQSHLYLSVIRGSCDVDSLKETLSPVPEQDEARAPPNAESLGLFNVYDDTAPKPSTGETSQGHTDYGSSTADYRTGTEGGAPDNTLSSNGRALPTPPASKNNNGGVKFSSFKKKNSNYFQAPSLRQASVRPLQIKDKSSCCACCYSSTSSCCSRCSARTACCVLFVLLIAAGCVGACYYVVKRFGGDCSGSNKDSRDTVTLYAEIELFQPKYSSSFRENYENEMSAALSKTILSNYFTRIENAGVYQQRTPVVMRFHLSFSLPENKRHFFENFVSTVIQKTIESMPGQNSRLKCVINGSRYACPEEGIGETSSTLERSRVTLSTMMRSAVTTARAESAVRTSRGDTSIDVTTSDAKSPKVTSSAVKSLSVTSSKPSVGTSSRPSLVTSSKVTSSNVTSSKRR